MTKRRARVASLSLVWLALVHLAPGAIFADSKLVAATLISGKVPFASTEDSKLRQRFFSEYPPAAARLKRAVERLRCKGRYRSVSPSRSEQPWLDFSVLVYDGKVRFERKVQKYNLLEPVAEAVLITPGLSAKVVEPLSEFAWLEYEGAKPSNEILVSTVLYLYRFLHAAFSIDGESIVDGISQKKLTVHNVTRHPENRAFVLVECTHRETEGDPKWRAEGTLSLVLSPAEDWAVREIRLTSMPYGFEMRATLDVAPLGDVGFVPRNYRVEVFGIGSSEELREKHEFEVTETAFVESVSAEEFSLEALGIRSRPRSPRVALTVVSLVVIVFLVVNMWLHGLKTSKRRHSAAVRNPI